MKSLLRRFMIVFQTVCLLGSLVTVVQAVCSPPTADSESGSKILLCITELNPLRNLLEIAYELSVWTLMSLNIVCPIWQVSEHRQGLLSNSCGLGSLSVSLLSYSFGRYADPSTSKPTLREVLNQVGALVALVTRLVYALSKAAGAAGYARTEAVVTATILMCGSLIVLLNRLYQYSTSDRYYTVIFVAGTYIIVLMILGLGYVLSAAFYATTLVVCNGDAITDDEPGIKDVVSVNEDRKCFQYYNNVGGRDKKWWETYAMNKVDIQLYARPDWPVSLDIQQAAWKEELPILYWKIIHHNKYVTVIATDGLALIAYVGCFWIGMVALITSNSQNGDPHWLIIQTFFHAFLNLGTGIVGIIMLSLRTRELLRRIILRVRDSRHRTYWCQVEVQRQLGLTYIHNLFWELAKNDAIFRYVYKGVNIPIAYCIMLLCMPTAVINVMVGFVFRMFTLLFLGNEYYNTGFDANITSLREMGTEFQQARRFCELNIKLLKYINSVVSVYVDKDWFKSAMGHMGIRTLDQEAIGAYEEIVVTHDTIDIAILACIASKPETDVESEQYQANQMLEYLLREIIEVMNGQNDDNVERRGKSTVIDQAVWEILLQNAKTSSQYSTTVQLSSIVKRSYRRAGLMGNVYPTTTEGTYHVLCAQAWDETISIMCAQTGLETNHATIALSALICAGWSSWPRPKLSSVQGLQLITKVKLVCMFLVGINVVPPPQNC